MRQGEKFVCLGEDQYLYVEKQEGDEMPQALQFDDDDCDSVKQMKQLILEMTSYTSEDRPSSGAVFEKTLLYQRSFLQKVGNTPPQINLFIWMLR